MNLRRKRDEHELFGFVLASNISVKRCNKFVGKYHASDNVLHKLFKPTKFVQTVCKLCVYCVISSCCYIVCGILF